MIVRTDYREPKCWSISRTVLREKRKDGSRSLPLEQGAQHLWCASRMGSEG